MNINDDINFISVEKEVTYIRRRYHIEDYIAEKNIPGDAYGRILHFILMPVFSIHLPFFFCEIARFSGMIVLYYRLTETALSALVKFDDKITFPLESLRTRPTFNKISVKLLLSLMNFKLHVFLNINFIF